MGIRGHLNAPKRWLTSQAPLQVMLAVALLSWPSLAQTNNNNNNNNNSSTLDSDAAIVNSAFDDVLLNGTTTTTTTTTTTSTTTTTAAPRPQDGQSGGDGGFSMAGVGGSTIIRPALNSDIPPPEDRARTLEVVRQAHQNLLEPVIKTNKSNAFLSCETGEMIVKMNFTEPFRGVAYADYDRASPCKFFGDGATYYEMRLPLKGCGTKQEAPRLFLNNIIVRYHRLLELEEDEIKTIVCRYPPPQAPPPPPPPVGPPERIIDAPPEPAKLTQYEPLVIIAGLLFFTLMMLGLGAGSYLVKRRNIRPVHTPLPPPPLAGLTDHDTYLDNQSIITTEELETHHKNTLYYGQPQLDTQYIDDTFVTTVHEIDTYDDIVHHKDSQYFRPIEVGQQQLEDTYITNEEDITTQDLDTYHKMVAPPAPPPKYLVKNIEDTFITKVDEIDEHEQISTIHRKRKQATPPQLTTTTTTITDEYISDHELDEHTATATSTTNTNTRANGVARPIKSRLTTTEQYKQLQTIVEIFEEEEEELVEEVEQLTSRSRSTSELARQVRQRLAPKLRLMPHYDRTTLRSLLTEDETFKSMVMDTISSSSTQSNSIKSIRHHGDYTNRLTIETWSLFEEILTMVKQRTTTTTTTKPNERATTTYREEYEELHEEEEEELEESRQRQQMYEQIGQQQHYYNYDHVRQIPANETSHNDPDFDSRTYTKSDVESRESLPSSPDVQRRANHGRIRGRREHRPPTTGEFTTNQWDTDYYSESYRSHQRGLDDRPSLLSDGDLQHHHHDHEHQGHQSSMLGDNNSLPDYGDNYPMSYSHINSAYQMEEEEQQQRYAPTGRAKQGGGGGGGGHDDPYDNEENFPVYTATRQQRRHGLDHKSKSSSRKKSRNNQHQHHL